MLILGSCELELSRHRLRCSGRVVELTRIELRLLALLGRYQDGWAVESFPCRQLS